MKTIKIDDWSEFDEMVSSKHYRKWIYRGQSDFDWVLESSLHRAFEEAKAIHLLGNKHTKLLNKREHEKVMIDRFKRNAHLYLSHLPSDGDDLSWLSLMQHHGAPTRLLDFTFSAYIALFFALEYKKCDAALYCINHHAIRGGDEEYFTDRLEVYSRILDGEMHSDDQCLFAFEPTFSSQRLLSQQGLLVATNTLKYTHEKIIDGYDIEEGNVLKIKIPASLRLSGLKKLNQMNINSANIYHGIDGFCKSMRRQPIFGLAWQKRIGHET